MKCPYCAETIQEGAVVCPHCRHSIVLATPVLERLTALESRVRESVPEGPASSAPPAGSPWVWLVALPVVSIAGMLSTLWAWYLPQWFRLDTPFLITGLLPPLVLGLAVGYGWQTEKRLLKYFLGLPFALVNLALVVAVASSGRGSQPNWVWILLVFNVGQPWIYASAVWMAEWLRPTNQPSTPPSPVIGSGPGSRWPEKLKLLVPLLSQVASILATSRYLIQAFHVTQ